MAEHLESTDAAAADEQRRARIGRWFVFAASVLWSTNGLFVKNNLFSDWPSEQRGALLGVWRALFAALTLLPLVRKPQFSWRLVPMAVCFAAMSITFLQSMVWTTAANAIWLQNIAPAWLCVFALVGREPIDRRDLRTLAFAACGIGLILVCELRRSDATALNFYGVLLGLTSGLCYAGIIFSLRKLRDFDPAWLIVVNLSTSALALSPAPFVTGIWPHGWQWPALAAFGCFQLGLAYYCFARGVKSVSSQEAAGLGLLEPLLVPIWVALTIGEIPAWWTIVGGGLILVGLALRYRRISS